MPTVYGQSIDFKVVLVRGDENDCAAYRGIGPAEWVAANGDKLNLREAIAHFPLLESYLEREHMTYRER